MSDEKAKKEVVENAKLCAEQGWKGTFKLLNGEVIEKAYITATNWDEEVVKLERIGERHLPPRILYLREVDSVEVGWT